MSVLKRILVTDGNVGFLAGGGLVMLVAVGVLILVFGAPSALAAAVALLAPIAVLWPAALLWAVAVRRVLESAPQVPGRVTRARVTWRGLLFVDFVYVVAGTELRASNAFMPRSRATRLRPDRIVNVAVSRSTFPGPLIVDPYV